jgi:hypothetical protein
VAVVTGRPPHNYGAVPTRTPSPHTGLDEHLLSEHVGAALPAGWTLVEMRERVIDDAWLAVKPKWGRCFALN